MCLAHAYTEAALQPVVSAVFESMQSQTVLVAGQHAPCCTMLEQMRAHARAEIMRQASSTAAVLLVAQTEGTQTLPP